MDSNDPTFFEQVRILLGRLNEAFPDRDNRKHNITLDDAGNIMITIWGKNKEGAVGSWFIGLEDDGDDDLKSIDDVVEELSKYVSDSTK